MTEMKDFLKDNLENYITNNNIFIFFILLFILFLLYISNKIGKKKEYCKTIRSERGNSENSKISEFMSLEDLDNYNYLSVEDPDGSIYDYTLKDFYIKTAYNCFCNSGFRNGYVDECALKNCASYGVRALHMQIFSLDGIPIIGANSVNTNEYKETYNNIKFKDAISTIHDVFKISSDFGGIQDGNNLKNDPLFLILQLHYGTNLKNDKNVSQSITEVNNKINFYNKIYESLVEEFRGNFASSTLRDTYKGDYDSKKNSRYGINDYVMNMKMSETKNKIFIFVIVNGDNDYTAIRKSKLHDIVDLYEGNGFVSYRYDDMLGLDRVSTIEKSKNNLIFCMPPLTSSYANNDFVQAIIKGIQFVGMNFQNSDYQLQLYNKFFINQKKIGTDNVKTSPYIKKDDSLIDYNINFNVDKKSSCKIEKKGEEEEEDEEEVDT